MQTFKEKVQAMTASEIIMAMVNGVRKEWVKLNFTTFGEIEDGICYGCAATNTICEIAGKAIPSNMIGIDCHPDFLGNKEDAHFIETFEMAINSLRQSNFTPYNERAKSIGVAEIKSYDDFYIALNNRMSKQEIKDALLEFEKLAKLQKQ